MLAILGLVFLKVSVGLWGISICWFFVPKIMSVYLRNLLSIIPICLARFLDPKYALFWLIGFVCSYMLWFSFGSGARSSKLGPCPSLES